MALEKQLERFLKKNEFITIEEARAIDVSKVTLSRLVQKEELYRTERGVYTNQLDWLTDPLKKYLPVCTRISEAIICGVSALTYYDLTDEEERKIWIALPAEKKIRDPRFRVIRPAGVSYSMNIKRHRFGKRVVRIYDIEKSVIDAFKYLTEEAAYKALKGYLKRKDANVQRLCADAKNLRKPLDQVVRAIMADE